MAAVRLLSTEWSHRAVQPVHGPRDLTFAEVAAEVGEAIERPVRFVQSSDADTKAALLGAGASEAMADAYVRMFAAAREGVPLSDPRDPVTTTPTTLGAWAYAELRPLLTASSRPGSEHAS